MACVYCRYMVRRRSASEPCSRPDRYTWHPGRRRSRFQVQTSLLDLNPCALLNHLRLHTLTQHAASNQFATSHASSPSNTPLLVLSQCSPSLSLLVLQHTDQRTVNNSTFDLPEIAAVGNPIPGPDSNTIDQVSLDVPHQRAD